MSTSASDSFKLDELTSGFINYVQSEHEGAEPTADQLLISVSDGAHHSASTPVRVVINPANDEKPSLHLANFTVRHADVRERPPPAAPSDRRGGGAVFR